MAVAHTAATRLRTDVTRNGPCEARDVVESALPLVAAFIAHSLGLFAWSARVIVRSVLLFVAPALLVVTFAHAPLTILLLAVYIWRIGRAMCDERDDDRFAVATVFAAAFYVDAAALSAFGHPVVALEIAFAAPFVRRVMLASAFSRARVRR